MKTVSLIAVLLAASPAVWAQKGHQADPREVCKNDVKDSEGVIKQGFFWVNDAATADRLSGRLMANVACEAKARSKKAANSKSVCAALDKIGPAYRYEKSLGNARVNCEWQSDYADFIWEALNATKTQTKFPACVAYLDRLSYPAKFFDINAKAPPTGEAGNDGGFWNVCRTISQKMQAGSVEMCEPRLKHYFGPQVPAETGFTFCRAAARLWAKGDTQFCDMLKPNNEKCLVEAMISKALVEKNQLLCPPSGPERGVCIEKLGPQNRPCVQTWQELQDDFCSERATVSLEALKNMKKGPKQAPRTGEQGGGGR